MVTSANAKWLALRSAEDARLEQRYVALLSSNARDDYRNETSSLTADHIRNTPFRQGRS